ncbi:MAG TPA: DUF748 domain-containing protein [Thermoanaerobaculia bacterium]|nr:DUF748 domain-containing protein [Thermoanaerobaculia bacterium]
MKLRSALGHPRTRRAFGIAAAILALWAVAGFLVLPHFLRSVIERKLAESLHRPVTLRKLSLNPFALSATLEGLEVKEKGGIGRFFSFDRLYANLEAVSLFRRAPVVRAITLTNPSLTIVRNLDGSYNFQDLLEEKPAKSEKPQSGPPRFSLNNIRVEGGSVDFDDRPMRTKHTLRGVKIGIPFLSSIPSEVKITTEPVLQAVVNGAPFALHGKTKPLSPAHETTLDFRLSDVDLPYYLAYFPSLPVRLTAGRLDANLTVAFAQPPNRPPALVVSGTSALRKLAVEKGGTPFLAWERFEVVLDSLDVFARRVRIRSLKADAPELWIRRDRTGSLNVPRAFVEEPARNAKTAPRTSERAEPAAPPMILDIGEAGIEKGRIHYDDFSVDRPFHALFGDVAVSMKGFSTAPGKTASLTVAAKSDADETLRSTDTVSLGPLTLDGAFEVGGLPLKRYSAFFDKLVTFDVDDGVLDVAANFRVSRGAKADASVSGLTAALRSPRLRKRGEKKPFFEAPSVKLTGTAFDLGRREATLGELSSDGGVLAVVRDKEGDVDVTNLAAGPAADVPAEPRTESPPTPSPDRPPAPSSAPWRVTLGRLALDGYTIRVEDQAPDRIGRYTLTKTNLLLENASTAPGARGNLAVRFGINGKGTASARGPVGIRPTFADLQAEVKALPLVPLEAYVLPNLRLSLARGTLTGGGRLTFGEDEKGKARVGFAGNALLADLLALDQSTKLDAFQWKTFSLEGIRAGLNPESVNVAKIGITGLVCDIDIDQNGTVNLAKVVGKPLSAEEEAAGGAAPAETSHPGAPPTAAETGPPAATATTTTATAAATTAATPIHVDLLTLRDGRIGFTDHFIRPNYAATLGDLEGSVTGLDSKEGTVAQLEARGRLANRSPLEISGSVNPLSATAFADVKATFRDIDLPQFTAFSGKYVGYAIARGTLTMDVRYRLQNRKLSAQNRFLVDQLELGEKVESPDATKLPVRLAISLLKDKDGLIDLDLPIEGSLDDPKFRIGKVIWHVLGNLIGKAATAPFALLGKLFGGKGEEFSSVDFADGRDALDEAAKTKLDTLARALASRPALKLEATGRFSGEKDLEGLRRLRFERKIKAQKLADLVTKGEAPEGVDAVVVDEKEYETYLKKAYKKEKFAKPRNVLGMAKDLPPPEMEKLMLENLSVTTDDLRQLALDRANAVKDYLTGPGKVEAGRVFVLEPGDKPAEPTAKAGASRVDFTLK